MALVSMRQLLEPRGGERLRGPGVSTSIISKQVQAIMEAAAELDAPVIMQASAGCSQIRRREIPEAPDRGRGRELSPDPGGDAQDHGQSPAGVRIGDPSGIFFVMMDGSLKEDGKTVADYDYNWQVHPEGGRGGARDGRQRRGRARLSGFARDDERRQGGRSRRRGKHDARDAADRSRPGGRFRPAHPARRAGDRDRHLARRLQVHAQADPATSWRSTGSRRSTGAFRTRTW